MAGKVSRIANSCELKIEDCFSVVGAPHVGAIAPRAATRPSNAAISGLTCFQRHKGSPEMIGREIATAAFTALAMPAHLCTTPDAAHCGSSAAGFEAWKGQFSDEALAKTVR